MRFGRARRAGAARRLAAFAVLVALGCAGAAWPSPEAQAYARPELPAGLREDAGRAALLAPLIQGGAGGLAGMRRLDIPPGAPTLAPAPESADAVDAVRLAPKRTAVLRGSGSWDDGFDTLNDSFALLLRRTSEAGVAPAGRPFVLFTETDDRGFRFSAMLPVAPDAPELATIGLEEGKSPSGHALRFVHAGPFVDIDATYDLITSHLEAEGFEAQENFVEEYVVDALDDGDPALVVFIYVFLR